MTTAQPASAHQDLSRAERYRKDGYLVINDLIDASEIAQLSKAVEMNADTRCYREAEGTIHLLGITERHPAFLALARHPRILTILEELIGPDIVLNHSKLAAKPLQAGQGEFPWHQDGAYYPHTNADVPSVMVMLDDSTPDNGCMYMVRGSHRLGYLNHEDAEGYFSGMCQDRVWERVPEDVVAITPRAGGISIHSPFMLHYSPVNHSGAPRRGLTFAYRAADSYQLADDLWSETGMVVHGAYRGVVRCDGSSMKLPRIRPGTPRGDFGTAWNQTGPFGRQQNQVQGLRESGIPPSAL